MVQSNQLIKPTISIIFDMPDNINSLIKAAEIPALIELARLNQKFHKIAINEIHQRMINRKRNESDIRHYFLKKYGRGI